MSSQFPEASQGSLTLSINRHSRLGPLPWPLLGSLGPAQLAGIIISFWFLGYPYTHPSLWAQLSSEQTSDSMDATIASKTQFLQKIETTVSLLSFLEWGMGVSGSKPGELEEQLQEGLEPLPDPILWVEEGPDYSRVSLTCVQSGWPHSRLSAAEVEAEVGSLWKACSLLRLRMEEELAAGQWTLIQVSDQGGKGCRTGMNTAYPP